MRWRLEVADPALADMADIPSAQLPPILRAFRLLARDPSACNIKKLQTPPDTWRMRVGKWRILFEFHEDEHILKVLGVSDRKDAY